MYVINSKRSVSTSRVNRIFHVHRQADEQNVRDDTLTKKGFLEFYLRACVERQIHARCDIVRNGLGKELINTQFVKDEKYKIRNEFVLYLENKFIESEIILVKYFIKQAKMINIFNTLNNDIINYIIKMFHPLMLNNKYNNCNDFTISLINQKIRKFMKYTLNMQMNFPLIDSDTLLLYQPYFYNILSNQLQKQLSISDEDAKNFIQIFELKNKAIKLSKFAEFVQKTISNEISRRKT